MTRSLVIRRSQGIAHNLTVKEVFMSSTVEPSFIGRDIGDVTDPDSDWATSVSKFCVEQVICYRQGML